MKIVTLLFGVPACLGLVAACHLYSGSAAPAGPTSSAPGTGAPWRHVNGDSDETGYSRLDQITVANAGRLGLTWYLDLPGESSLEGSPIEAEGILYFTGTYAAVYAVDAVSGTLIWKFDPKTWQHNPVKMNFNFASNRGVAYANGRIFSAALDGRLFALDAKTGHMIWSTETTDPKVGQTVTGAPRVFNGKVIIGQGNSGMHSWMRMAYSPATGLVYVPTMQMATRLRKGAPEDDDFNVFGLNVASVGREPGDGKGSLVAWDPVAQKARWRVQLDTLWNGGAVSTAGNVVFQGAADGWFTAYDARTGARLWRANTGMGIIASPMTYAAGGKQYVAVLAGYGGSAAVLSDVMNVGWKYAGPRRLLTFVLDGKTILPPSDAPTLKVNVQDNPEEVLDPKQVAMGKAMFMACAACHGRQAVGAGGPAPDLRESAIPLNPDAFWTVVHDGALIERGMPRVAMFGKPQVEALRQYIRARARAELGKQ